MLLLALPPPLPFLLVPLGYFLADVQPPVLLRHRLRRKGVDECTKKEVCDLRVGRDGGEGLFDGVAAHQAWLGEKFVCGDACADAEEAVGGAGGAEDTHDFSPEPERSHRRTFHKTEWPTLTYQWHLYVFRWR